MRTRVEKCPGGLSVVVPEALAAEAGLREGGPADLELNDGRLVEGDVQFSGEEHLWVAAIDWDAIRPVGGVADDREPTAEPPAVADRGAREHAHAEDGR